MNVPGNRYRRPFLAPIGLFALIAIAGALVVAVVAWLLITSGSTTVIVMRHAEKVPDALAASADPPLTERGTLRAELLARMFGDARLRQHVDAIYTSPALRNRLTAAPLAARLGITPEIVPQDDPRALARRVLHEHRGGRVLVVGHVDTVPAIVAALSGAKDIPPIAELDYGTIYIVTVPRIGRASILTMSY
jgi:broad specificity phosphatase PhoE